MNGWLSAHAFELAGTGVLVWLAGLAVAMAGVARRRRVLAPARWPTVPGFVRGSDVRAVEGGYEPAVRYTYAVAGHVYQGHTVEAGPVGPFTRGEAAALVLRYAPECGVDVHYDPDDPVHAVLQAHAARAGVGIVALGVATVLAGAVLLVAGIALA